MSRPATLSNTSRRMWRALRSPTVTQRPAMSVLSAIMPTPIASSDSDATRMSALSALRWASVARPTSSGYDENESNESPTTCVM